MDFSLIDLNGSSIKEDIRKIRKKAYAFEVESGIDQLKRFYREMYLPYAIERYNEELLLEDLDDLINSVRNTEILLIKKAGEYVSGICLCYKNNNVTLKCIGVNYGYPKLVKSGAIQAIYYALFNHLKDKKHNRILLGGARAFFCDGLLNFKKKWGFRFTRCQHNVMRICLLTDTPGVRKLLVANPCIALEGKDLVVVVFTEKSGEFTKDDLKEYARYLWPGLKRVILYCFGNSGPVICKSTEQFGVTIRSAKELMRYQ